MTDWLTADQAETSTWTHPQTWVGRCWQPRRDSSPWPQIFLWATDPRWVQRNLEEGQKEKHHKGVTSGSFIQRPAGLKICTVHS